MKLNNFKIINLDKIKDIMSKNINIIQITKVVNGKLDIIDLGDNVIDVSLNDYKTELIENNSYLYKQKNKNIYSTLLGNVIKINKLSNNLYEVQILDENNNIITYSMLEEVTVKMYQIVKVNDLIGVASLNDNINEKEYLYYYLITINEN